MRYGNTWPVKEMLEHDSVPICAASISALTMLLDARAEMVDEQELCYLEKQMLDTFDAVSIKRGVQ